MQEQPMMMSVLAGDVRRVPDAFRSQSSCWNDLLFLVGDRNPTYLDGVEVRFVIPLWDAEAWRRAKSLDAVTPWDLTGVFPDVVKLKAVPAAAVWAFQTWEERLIQQAQLVTTVPCKMVYPLFNAAFSKMTGGRPPGGREIRLGQRHGDVKEELMTAFRPMFRMTVTILEAAGVQ